MKFELKIFSKVLDHILKKLSKRGKIRAFYITFEENAKSNKTFRKLEMLQKKSANILRGFDAPFENSNFENLLQKVFNVEWNFFFNNLHGINRIYEIVPSKKSSGFMSKGSHRRWIFSDLQGITLIQKLRLKIS